jgi:hypothetical protein
MISIGEHSMSCSSFSTFFLFGFSPFKKPTRVSSIRVAIQAIERKTPDFFSPGSTPSSDEERCPLVGTVKRADGWHELVEFRFGNVTGDALWQLW